MLYRTHIISDICYIGHTYQTYFCCIEHTHWIYLYYTGHIISDIFMLYRTCFCLSDTHRTYLFCIGHIISDIFVVSDIYYDWPIFYIGHFYVLSDVLVLYGTHITSDIFMLYRHVYRTYLCYIGHTFYRAHILDTHIGYIYVLQGP